MANSIYQPIFLEPNDTAIDSILDNTFSCVIDGVRIDSYNLKIYNRDTNVLLYDTGVASLDGVLYNGDSLEVEVLGGSITNGNGQLCKWTMEYFNGAESVVSYETPFSASTTPTLEIALPIDNIVTTQEYEFIGIYTQAEGVQLQQWQYILYDGNGVEINRSSLSFSGDIRYTFSGLISGNSYKIIGTAITQDNESISSELYEFSVDYLVPELEIVPTATVQKDLTSVELEWGEVITTGGVLTSGVGSYVPNFLYDGNYGYTLNPSGVLKYSKNQPLGSTYQQVWVPTDPSFSGKIIRRSNSITGDFCEVGYVSGVFYYNVNGKKTYTLPYSLFNSVFILVLRPKKLDVLQFNTN